MKIGIRITTYNRKRFTDQCLKSLLWSKPKHTEVCIVDNCSTDGTQDLIRKYLYKDNCIKTVILNNENREVGYSNVQAWSLLKENCDLLGCANNDFLFEPGWEDNILSCFEELDVDYVCSCMPLKWMESVEPSTTKDKKGHYIENTGVSAGYIIRTEDFLKGIRHSTKKFSDGYIGPGPTFHKLLKNNNMKGVQLHHPCILVRDCEYNNPDYYEYYNTTFSTRGIMLDLNKRRAEEQKGNPWGLIKWKNFLKKYYPDKVGK